MSIPDLEVYDWHESDDTADDDARSARLEERLKAVTAREVALVHRAAELALIERELDTPDARLVQFEARVAEAVGVAEEPYPAPDEAPPSNVMELPQRSGRWNLNRLTNLVEARGAEFPSRQYEWGSYLYFLRDYAKLDGSLPPAFDWLVEETFAELLALAPASVG
jgi:hypothetical protein